MTEPSVSNIKKLEHHSQLELCRTRPPYRQGKKLTAVKVELYPNDINNYKNLIMFTIIYYFIFLS